MDLKSRMYWKKIIKAFQKKVSKIGLMANILGNLKEEKMEVVMIAFL